MSDGTPDFTVARMAQPPAPPEYQEAAAVLAAMSTTDLRLMERREALRAHDSALPVDDRLGAAVVRLAARMARAGAPRGVVASVLLTLSEILGWEPPAGGRN